MFIFLPSVIWFSNCFQFIEDIHQMYSHPSLLTKLIALSVSGHVYVLSTETMDIDQFIRHTTSNSILVRSFNFSPESCSFVPRLLDSDGSLIIRFISTNKSLFMKIGLLSSSGMKEIAVNQLCDNEVSPVCYIVLIQSKNIRMIRGLSILHAHPLVISLF